MEQSPSDQDLCKRLTTTAPRNMAATLRLETLPWDIIEEIAKYLKVSDFVHLCKTSKASYKMAQPLLWHHPRISDPIRLTLFANFLNRPPVLTVPPIEDWDRVCRDRGAQVKRMTLCLDPEQVEQASEVLGKITEHCPHVMIKLFVNGKLPRRYMLQDPRRLFPRVTTLIITRAGMAPDPRDFTNKGITCGPTATPAMLKLDDEMQQVTQEMKREEAERIEEALKEDDTHPCLRLIAAESRGRGRGSLTYSITHDPAMGAEVVAKPTASTRPTPG